MDNSDACGGKSILFRSFVLFKSTLYGDIMV